MLCYFFFIFVQVKIVIFNSTLLRQQPGVTDTRDCSADLRGSQWAGVFLRNQLLLNKKVKINFHCFDYGKSYCRSLYHIKMKKKDTIIRIVAE